MNLTRENLINCFEMAQAKSMNYVAVLIEMEGFDRPEVIINPLLNFDKKFKYYLDAYDENLNHNHAKGIKIIGFTYSNNFEDIEFELML